ncbi:AMP-binding protein [Clostridium sp.]|uniref:AMP-binding protein n=1 Tax=Clostridium sp. TaxID=1506 RepID=UPI00262BD269|nr:AMP-binding protein [Clostridium sp.]
MKENMVSTLKYNNSNTFEYYENGKKYKKYFSELYIDVIKVLNFLTEQNLKKGDRIGILAENSYAWVVLDLACILGGIVVAAFHTSNFENELDDIFSRYKLEILCVDDKYIKNITCKGKVIEISNVIKQLDLEKVKQREYKEFSSKDEVFTMIFTSGTTGTPKAIELKSEIIEDFVFNLEKLFKVNSNDKIIMFLPLSHILQRLYVYGAILLKFNMVMTPPENVIKALQIDKPTILVAIPYFYQSIYNVVYGSIKSSVKNYIIFKMFLLIQALMPKRIKEKLRGKFLKPLIDFWGGKMRILVTGGAAISKNVLKFYNYAGITLYEVYGMSELGPISINYPRNYKMGSVGKPLSGKKIRFDENGQILVNSEMPWAKSYFNASEIENNQVFKEEGYVATGDIGYVDKDGFLYIKGRIKEMIVLSNGKKVHPGIVENEFSNGNYIKQAAVFGEGESFLTAVIVKNDNNVALENIENEIKKINKKLPDHAKIKRFVIAKEDFNISNKMISNSMKLNRTKIYETYKNQLMKIYS